MKGKERSAVLSLASIFAFRMLGLFMILPVFAVSAAKMHGSSAALIGLALGVYGLTQALLQIPFGMSSDRIGRKPVIAIGLILFAIGSVVAALSHSIHGLIIGRALQGSGAVGSTILALVADLTCDENRSKAMAFVGLTIGLSFSLAMVLGPIINAWFALSGIFWFTAVLALLGVVMLFVIVPTPPKLVVHEVVETKASLFKDILKDKALLRLDLGIFSLHAILTAMFLAIPIILTKHLGLPESKQVLLYLGVLALAFISVVPLIIIAEKKRKMKSIFIAAIVTLLLAQLVLGFVHHSAWSVAILLFVFFAAFTLLEATLPSMVSKIAPIRAKGTAMGVYSTSQFFGIFIGGSVGGLVFANFHLVGIFLLCVIIALIWLAVAISMTSPPYLSTLIIKPAQELKEFDQELSLRLKRIPGVADVAYMANEGLVYLKVDKKIVNEPELRNLLGQGKLSSAKQS